MTEMLASRRFPETCRFAVRCQDPTSQLSSMKEIEVTLEAMRDKGSKLI